MSLIQRFLAWLNADTIFLRTSMVIAGSCIFFGLAWVVSRDWSILEWWAWLVLVPFGGFGLVLMILPLFLSDERFERYLDLMADGGDIPVILFFVVVMLVAIPMTVVVRLIKKAFA